jgi:TIR domain/Pentapeptide repeats (8 copies)
MANEEHVAILKKGVRTWNWWRDQNLDIRPDLSGADLSGPPPKADSPHLRPQVEFTGINLEKADLWGANLEWVGLRNARVVGADLGGANLRYADLGEADLSYSELSHAVFDHTRLVKTSFMGSRVSNTLFVNVDLSKAKDLETVNHLGPSSIGIDTIYESQGKIPDVFLLRAGVPEPFIVQMKALVAAMEPIQFYSCFISYSSKDQEFAERLYADLQSRNVRCWFAPHDVQGGKKLHEQIDEAIRVHEKLLLILSPDSMGSEWVKTELAKARKREVRENRRVLFPMRLCSFEELRDWECFDADTGKDSAREIREYFIPDFSDWKEHDKYKAAFDRLIRDLKA